MNNDRTDENQDPPLKPRDELRGGHDACQDAPILTVSTVSAARISRLGCLDGLMR